jgi:hypothetical protein
MLWFRKGRAMDDHAHADQPTIYFPPEEGDIYAERQDVESEREVILSSFAETSWGGCGAMSNS